MPSLLLGSLSTRRNFPRGMIFSFVSWRPLSANWSSNKRKYRSARKIPPTGKWPLGGIFGAERHFLLFKDQLAESGSSGKWPLRCTTVTKFYRMKLQLYYAIYRLRFYSKSLIHILSFSNLHNNAASMQKNRGDKSHCVIVAWYE